jgi:hypothetical protein
MIVGGAAVPLSVRVRFAHAVVQRIADADGLDVLHIKGEAIDPSLAAPNRQGTDADVLVRPSHIPRLLDALQAHGWDVYSTFETGSPFGHAVTLQHGLWGHADVHRHFPGATVDPERAFDLLWRDRSTVLLAGVRCAVPSLVGQVAILVLNAARSGRGPSDLKAAWEPATPQRRADVRALVAALGAEVGFAAATGDLDRYRDRPDYDLWRVTPRGGTRLEEWRARIKAAPDRRAAIRIALRAPLVNVDQLSHQLGRQPTRRDLVRASLDRARQGARELAAMARRRGSAR